MPKIGKEEKARRDRGAIIRLKEKYPEDATIELAGDTYTRAQLIAIFEGHLEILGEIHALTIERDIAIGEERKVEPLAKRLAFCLGKGLKAEMGPDAPMLRKYGVEPEKTPYVSARPRRGPSSAAARRGRSAARWARSSARGSRPG